MSKIKLDEMSKEQLTEREEQLINEIETLQNIIDASNTTVFDLLIKEVKQEMINNIYEEEWKKLKENQKKIESYYSIERTLQNQEDLLERKKDELYDTQQAIKYYQQSLFEDREEETEEEQLTEGEVIDTGYNTVYKEPLRTGDVFKSNLANATNGYWYYLIKKSSEKEDSFAVISNYFEGERLLQYPKNIELLDYTHYTGNIYIEDEDQENALNGLKQIADSQ